MKLNPGIVTSKLKETKEFYIGKLGFQIVFENDWYILLSTPNGKQEISFLLPNLPSQHPAFQKEYAGFGMYLTIETEDVDSLYFELKKKNLSILLELKEEEWGDRHFVVSDPNGIGIDFVKYTAPVNA
ncbi:VOC family protein [Leptospira haakeii]|uniref:Glyoxalase n=1 Tax=Leptospira haakeii TaxID=2023198 RepID=A0ABX4PGF1_9LEPT|nr:VOC family protein [Leptospira haakeii]PKA14856.1 glyoxalase [Leptospira haakeii]PKA18138.1 glyoxalase [Leptospira haakeii]